MKVLVVIDMQNDFIDGSLGTPEASAIVPAVAEKIRTFDGEVFFTRDTHSEDYLNTQEGHMLPVRHCIKDTHGWQIADPLLPLVSREPINKPSFGSTVLAETLKKLDNEQKIEEITLIGLCTDICVISNALLIKASLPEVPVSVDASCCAGVSPASHQRALDAMKVCQIIIS